MSAPRRGFASDNYAGALPEVLQALAAANGGHARAYGADELASKMRFLSVQLAALLTDDLWRRTAAHANAMARRLAERLEDAVTITQPVESNAVFAILTPEATARLQRDWPFYVWNETTGEVRWMCSWDTTEEDVDAFAAAVRATR